MFVVRVNHKNNLYLEFLFMDPGRADACAKECAAAKMLGNSHPPKAAACEVRDDAGRVTWLEGSQIQSVQYAPIEEEVRFNTRLRVVAQLTAESWLKETGLDTHPLVGLGTPNGRAVPPAPATEGFDDRPAAIGGAASTFS